MTHAARAPLVGVAYGPGTSELLESEPGLVDFVEIPFEQLRHAPALESLQAAVPLILHCASLSVAGFVPPDDALVEAVARQAERIRSPWIGEHLAFITAAPLDEADDERPTSLTYTMCPQLSEETLELVTRNVAALRPRLPVPLIVENSPQYFFMPGSTMRMAEFVTEVVKRCDIDLLLDLSHFLITALNTRVDPFSELDLMPLERVTEVHLSGIGHEAGLAWDDHAAPAPPAVFALLERLLHRARPRALTIEYNWSAHFPRPVLRQHLERVRTLFGDA